MPKGFFTQAVAVLLRQTVTLADIREFLSGFQIAKEVWDTGDSEFGGPCFVVEYRPSVNGYVSVDVVDRQWPDHMGDPKKEPMLFAAWSMGHYGPFALPNGLKRAIEQSWGWEGAAQAVAGHNAFVRLRLSYVFGAGGDDPVMPKDCDPVDELRFLTKMVQALLAHPAAICYFNPSGELLMTREMLEGPVRYYAEKDLPAVNAWCNVRLFNLGDSDPKWILMDSVGNWQLDFADMEAAFPSGAFAPEDVGQFIRDFSLYLAEKGMVVKDGDTTDGPGGIRWQARSFDRGLSDPPRQVLRWLPIGNFRAPPELLGHPSEGAQRENKPWWRLW